MNLLRVTHSPAIPLRRKHQKSSMAVVLRRKYGILASPLFQRKHPKQHSAISACSSPVNFRQAFVKSGLSARKLAAGLWKLRFMEVSGDGGAAVRVGPFHTSKSQLEYFPSCRKCSQEKATKLYTDIPEVSNELIGSYNRKLVDDRKVRDDSVVSALQAELLQVQRCINELKAAWKSSEEKFEQFEQKLQENIIFWKRRERQKIQAMFDDLKDRLERERRIRERMELLNFKLVHELAEAHQYARQFVKYYDETQRGRELMAEVSNESAKHIREGKAKLEEVNNTGLGSPNCRASSASKLRSCQSNVTTGTVAKTSLHKRPGNGGYRYQDSEAQQYSPDFMSDDCNRRFSTDPIRSAQITSPRKDFGKDGFKHRELAGQRNLTNAINPHITRGMKGCREWPLGIPKTNSKAICVEARVRSQRSHLQQVLKPKT